MAALLYAQGKLAEAESLFLEALAGCREALGDEHPSTLNSIANMAELLHDQGMLAEADAMFCEAYKGNRSLFGKRHKETVESAHCLGTLLKARGMHAEAAPLLAMSLEVCALPSCDRSHRVGVKLKHCTGCKSVMYCCPVRAPPRPLAMSEKYCRAVFACPPIDTDRHNVLAPNPQEHQLEHWKQAEGGHKAECRRLKAEKEAADADAAAELARLSLGAAGPSARAAGASASGRGRRSSAQRGGVRGVAGAAGATGGAAGTSSSSGGGGGIQIGELD